MSIATTTEPRQAVEPSDQPQRAENVGSRRYMYCIIDCDEPTGPRTPHPPADQPEASDASPGPLSFGPIGIGSGHPDVFVIAHQGVGAVVSRTSSEKFQVSRENTIVHQRVMEAAMARGHTVLPVRFGTVAEDKPDGSADAENRLVNHVLAARVDELSGLLATYSTRDELGVKGLWTDMKAVFGEIIDSNEDIRSLRDKLLAGSRVRPGARRRGHVSIMDGKPRLGEMVKNALEAKKVAAEKELAGCLSGTVVDVRTNKTFGDPMFTNLAVLVEKSRTPELDARLSAFEAKRAGRVKIKYVGPVPPSNFIEVVIRWDD